MKRFAAVLSVVLCSLVALTAEASQPLDVTQYVGQFRWGATVDEVMTVYREQMVDRFRKQSAGIGDPVKVEELRREVDASVKRAAESLEAFPDSRTGYETSVVSGEFLGGADASMVTIRPTASMLGRFQYLVFVSGRLTKVLVPYETASINYMPMILFQNEFIESFGKADDVVTRLDDLGVKNVHEVTWDDGVNRVRLLERPAAVASHLLIVEDATLPKVSGQVDASIKPRRSVEDMLGGDAPMQMRTDDE